MTSGTPTVHLAITPQRESRAVDAGFRSDIQALRAIAVVLVVVYHVWPTLLPGGFVGVDVFFVISGFLITAHLRQQAEGTRGLSLLGFYARRIRRLLPASLLVLLVTTVGILLWVPRPQWPIDLGAVLSGTFYVENWFLAATATDYLSGSVAASNPVQHYWSLSAEEQFYLVWPVLILLATAFTARRGRRSVTFWMLAALTGASFVTSILWSAGDPGVAYFATPTRAWEFGLGSLLTFVPLSWTAERSRRVRICAVWLGIALIVASALTFGAVSAFPGWIALIPVGGALLVVAATQPRGALSLQPVAELAPVQRVGDWSYAIYLWHWPILILMPMAIGEVARSNAGKVGVVLATVVLAWSTREWVEKPFIRLGRRGAAPRSSTHLSSVTLAGALVGMIVVTLVALPPLAIVSADASSQRQALTLAQEGDPTCFGAASIGVASCASETTSVPVPGPLIAGADQSALSACQVAPHAPAHHCVFGPEDGVAVALVGDSHASQWLVAVQKAADALGWRVTTYLAGACPLFLPQPGMPASMTRGCSTWQENTLSELREQHYAYVLVSSQPWDALDRPSGPAGSTQFHELAADVAREYAAAWDALNAAGSEVIVLADTPNPNLAGRGDIPSCVERSGPAACALPREAALASTEPLVLASQIATGAHVVDVNDRICPGDEEECQVVVGGVLVWADASHLTKTYVSTLAPEFIRRITQVLNEHE